jgi:hypothetical protein
MLTEHHATNACWGSGGIALCILDLGARWRLVVSFTPRPLYPQGKSTCYPLDRRLGGPQSRSGRGGEKKNSQPLPAVQRYTTELTWLLNNLLKILCMFVTVVDLLHRNFFGHFALSEVYLFYDLDVDGKILVWIWGKQGGKVWTCYMWLRIGTSGGILWTW